MRWLHSSDSSSMVEGKTPSMTASISTSVSKLSVSTFDEEPIKIVGWKGEEIVRPSNIICDPNEKPERSPLNSSSSFQSGKQFWMKFLEKTSPTSASSSEGGTPLGREIRPTVSTESSLTPASYATASKTSTNSPAMSALETPTSNVSSLTGASTGSSNKRHFRARSSTLIDGKRTPSHQDRPSPVAYPLGKSPGHFGFEPRDQQGSRVNTPPPASASSFHKKPSPRSNSFTNAYNAWQRAGLMEISENSSPLPVSTTTRTLKENEPKPRNNAPSRVLLHFSEQPSTGGNPYQVWQKASLMKKSASTATSHNMVNDSKPSSQQEDADRSIKNDPSRVLRELPNDNIMNTYGPWQRAGLMKTTEKGTSKKTVKLETSYAKGKPSWARFDEQEEGSSSTVSSLDTEEIEVPVHEFQSVMNKWHTKSKESTGHPSVDRIETNDRDQQDDDFFSQMREKLSPRLSVSVEKQAETTNTRPKISPRDRSIFQKQKSPTNVTSFSETVQMAKQRLSPREENNFRNNDSKKKMDLSKLCENRALILVERNNTYELLAGETSAGYDSNRLVLKNVERVSKEHAMLDQNDEQNAASCACSRSIFSGNDDLINFFLPQMGMACSCGQQKWGLADTSNPTAIENVLRPWQCVFLKKFGIYHADQLVKARHRSAGTLAKSMRQWRIQQGMLAFRTSSCLMAIDIWAKTCKAYVRSIRKTDGNIQHHAFEMPSHYYHNHFENGIIPNSEIEV